MGKGGRIGVYMCVGCWGMCIRTDWGLHIFGVVQDFCVHGEYMVVIMIYPFLFLFSFFIFSFFFFS